MAFGVCKLIFVAMMWLYQFNSFSKRIDHKKSKNPLYDMKF